MAISFTPQAIGVDANGVDQNAVARLLAQRAAAAKGQGQSPALAMGPGQGFAPRSTGQAALGYGAVIGNALMERSQTKRDQAAVSQAATSQAEFLRQLGGSFANITPQQVLGFQLTNPEGFKTLMTHATEAAYRKPEVVNAPAGSNVYSIGAGPFAGGAPQGGAPARPGMPSAGAPGAPAGASIIQQAAQPTLMDAAERQALIQQGKIEPTDKRPIMKKADGTFDFVNPPPTTNVTASVNTASNPILEGWGNALVKGREAASGAADSIRSVHNAREQIDKGIISGFGADTQLGLARMGALLGITDPKQIANTETFRSAIGNSVLGQAKTLGSNPSEGDRKYIDAVMGGNISLNEQSIRNILDIQERLARGGIQRYNATAQKVIQALESSPQADQNGLAIARATGPVQEPDAYQQPDLNPGAPLPPQRPTDLGASTGFPTVSSPEEAMRLGPGKQFYMPDGRIGTVPGGQ